MALKTLYIQTNSPGELSRWVKPLVLTLHQKSPELQFTILLAPCQYATGEEKRLAEELPNVTEVLTPTESLKRIMTQSAPKSFDPNTTKGVFLGGDPFYLQRLGKRWGFPVTAYTEHNTPLKGYEKVFFKEADGDLMADSILNFQADRNTLLTKYKLKDRRYTIVFPGSRPQHFEFMFPLLLKALEHCRQKDPNFEAIIPLSPFIGSELEKKLSPKKIPDYIHTRRGDSLELISLGETVITIPGTNNTEAMYLGRPLLVFVPMNDPKRLIIDGIGGVLGKLPFIGGWIIGTIIRFVHKKKPYISAPNIRLKEKIVPEIVESLTPESTADHILQFNCNSKAHNDQLTAFKKVSTPPKVLEAIADSLLH